MKHRLLSLFCTLTTLLLTPVFALAEDEKVVDARLANYKGAGVDEASTALTWLLLIGLTVLCLAGLFKNAKRTHMD